MNEKLEVRNTLGNVIRQADTESRMVEGYALLFDTPSDGLNFEEVIDREALEGVVLRSDVFALLNHSKERGILARSINGEGSLTLEVDEKGLMYRFDAPNTALGNELLENLRRGEIDSSSFAFTIDEEIWENVGSEQEEKWLRTITKVRELFDVSPVYFPAYKATSCSRRALDTIEQMKADAERAKQFAQLDELMKKI